MKINSITLASPFDAAAGPVKEIKLREPTGRELLTIGEPFIQTRSPDGSFVFVENNDAIASYIDKLVVEPAGVNVLDRVGLADALALKDAVLGFFTDARTIGLAAAQISSSPNSDGSTPVDSATAA